MATRMGGPVSRLRSALVGREGSGGLRRGCWEASKGALPRVEEGQDGVSQVGGGGRPGAAHVPSPGAAPVGSAQFADAALAIPRATGQLSLGAGAPRRGRRRVCNLPTRPLGFFTPASAEKPPQAPPCTVARVGGGRVFLSGRSGSPRSEVSLPQRDLQTENPTPCSLPEEPDTPERLTVPWGSVKGVMP